MDDVRGYMKVLVTGATRNASMAIIRGLARQGVRVVGADERRLPFNSRSRYFGPYLMYPAGPENVFIEGLIEIIRREKPDLLLPVSNTRWISKNKGLIEKHTHVLLPDYPGYMAAFDNQVTLEECRKLGIECPEILREEELLPALERNTTLRHPLSFVLKPRANVGGAKGLGVFHDAGAFRTAKQKALLFGDACIQEYVPGGPENMRTVNLLFDKMSRPAAYFATKKIRSWPHSGGISVLSQSIHAPDLVDFVMPFFEKWHWQGMAEAEIKIDARDQKPKLIEINPRFCGYIGFAIECGVNFPWYICRITQGKEIPPSMYPAGIKYINWPSYVKSAFSEWKASPGKSAVIIKCLNELKGRKKTNNLEWADWKIIAAKILFELSNKEGASDVWN
jgi:predicted ATP-grasp superfamily ATP-dependent carboligase